MTQAQFQASPNILLTKAGVTVRISGLETTLISLWEELQSHMAEGRDIGRDGDWGH